MCNHISTMWTISTSSPTQKVLTFSFFHFNRCEIRDGAVDPFPIVKTMNIIKNIRLCFFKTPISWMTINTLLLDAGMEGLHSGIIVRTAFFAKGMLNFCLFKCFFVSLLGVLGSKITVENQQSFFIVSI